MFLLYIRCVLIINNAQGSLQIINITTRMPKPKDIGIIFDVTLGNFNECEELLAFSIRPNGFCCVNVTPDMVMRKMGRIVGGDFGFIEPGVIEKVSLILPTVALYDRIGLCPIALASTNINNEKLIIKQIIKFDTRYEILHPYNSTWREQKNFVDCRTLKNCTQADLKERYFGSPYLFNTNSAKYQELPLCSEKYQLYETFTKNGTNRRIIAPGKVLKAFEEGTQDNYVWESRSNVKEDQLLHPLQREMNQKWLQRTTENSGSDWLFGLAKGLLIVFLTITIYLLICFSIFLFVTWLSRRSNRSADKSGRGVILPTHQMGLSEQAIPLYTTCSLMSHR